MRVLLLAVVLALGCLTGTANAQFMSKAQGNCNGCGDGEAAFAALQTVGHGQYTYTATPGCGNPVATGDQIRAMLGNALKGKLNDFAGSALDLIGGPARDFLSANVHGDLGRLLNGGNNNTAACQVICDVIPTTATYVGYKLGAGEGANASSFPQCTPGHDCPIGWSKFPSEPAVSKDADAQLVCATFQNWSGDRTRRAQLIAYFKPAAGWAGPRFGD